jgi:hypothetical protein
MYQWQELQNPFKMNITTIQNGFNFNDLIYLFDGAIEVISESQCHVPTNDGIILLDLSCTINQVEFTDINLFITALKGE